MLRPLYTIILLSMVGNIPAQNTLAYLVLSNIVKKPAKETEALKVKNEANLNELTSRLQKMETLFAQMNKQF